MQTPETPQQLLQAKRDAAARIKLDQAIIAEIDVELQALRSTGVIGDVFEYNGAKITWTERKGNWQYSSALDDLKTLEEAEGIATRKPSSYFWTMKVSA